MYLLILLGIKSKIQAAPALSHLFEQDGLEVYLFYLIFQSDEVLAVADAIFPIIGSSNSKLSEYALTGILGILENYQDVY